MKLLVFTLTIILSLMSANAQSLTKQRIWKVADTKKSVYFDQGVFHSLLNSPLQSMKDIRKSYVSSRGYERVVFDFDSNISPKIYGHISSTQKKLYIDFFNTKIGNKKLSLTPGKYIKAVDFFDLDHNMVSVELSFNTAVNVDVFYLNNPARVVIDLKK